MLQFILARGIKRVFEPLLDPEACSDIEARPNFELQSRNLLLAQIDMSLLQRACSNHPGEIAFHHKGDGLSFSGLRQYVEGDDIRKIDWNVFARTRSTHVREYHVERQNNIWIFIDLSPSMIFGNSNLKAQNALILATLLISIYTKQKARIGIYICTRCEPHIIQPSTGQAHLHNCLLSIERIYRNELQFHAAAKSPELELELERFSRLAKHRSSIYLLSDFISKRPVWEKVLGNLKRKHSLNSFLISDPIEHSPQSYPIQMSFCDPESNAQIAIDYKERSSNITDTLRDFYEQIHAALKRTSRTFEVSSKATLAEILNKLFQSGTDGRNASL